MMLRVPLARNVVTDLLRNVPAAHAVQPVAVVVGANVPLAHVLQVVALLGE